MLISTDSLVIMLLCSRLGLPSDPDPAPLTLRQWNPIARKMAAAGLRPGSLLGQSAAQLAATLDEPIEDAEKLNALLDRRAAVELELQRLDSLGIWVRTRVDEEYPQRYRQRLKESAPVILYGAGDRYLPGQPGLAVVGSRNVNEAGQQAAEYVGNACAHHGLVVYSGGARGVDIFSMKAALEGRGTSVGVLAHSLVKAIRKSDYRAALERGDLTLLTSFSPDAGFSVGAAMGRNKLIYTLADYALVIASEVGKGGTWSGSTDALKHRWLPVFAAAGEDVPEGNRTLIERGAIPFPIPFPVEIDLRQWFDEKTEGYLSPPEQLKLI